MNIEENAKDKSEIDDHPFPFEKLCDFLSELNEETIDFISNDLRNIKLKAVLNDKTYFCDVLFYDDSPRVIVTLPFQVRLRVHRLHHIYISMKK